MTEKEAIISHIEECKHRINVIQKYVKTDKDANAKKCERNIFILENTIKAIEKQIAKKPTMDYPTIASCPICDEVICPHTEYCPDCGQKLDWGNEDAE